MTADVPDPAPRRTINIAFAVFVTIIAAVGAHLTFVIWALGIGIGNVLHNAIGVVFFLMNLGCWIAVALLVRKGRNGLALVVSLAPAPLSILIVYIVANV